MKEIMSNISLDMGEFLEGRSYMTEEDLRRLEKIVVSHLGESANVSSEVYKDVLKIRADYIASEPIENIKIEFNVGHDLKEKYGMEERARFLFDLLDDIDTISDMAKGDDKAYRSAVEEIQKKRFEVADTDGYEVWWKE